MEVTNNEYFNHYPHFHNWFCLWTISRWSDEAMNKINQLKAQFDELVKGLPETHEQLMKILDQIELLERIAGKLDGDR